MSIFSSVLSSNFVGAETEVCSTFCWTWAVAASEWIPFVEKKRSDYLRFASRLTQVINDFLLLQEALFKRVQEAQK